MTGLLVSVRSAAEAAAALAGGADLIDVKEPARGPLGRADDEVIGEVARLVAGRRPVSVAMGELRAAAISPAGINPAARLAKWGLAGCGRHSRWRERLIGAAAGLAGTSCQPVAVAYADWRLAGSPEPAEVCAFACDRRFGAFLLDTFTKDGRTLLDFLGSDALRSLRDQCRAAGVRIALAGSLGADEISFLLPLAPDWFAVRGAACAGGRQGQVSVERVRRLAELVTAAAAAG
ncbi:MAG TPA: (5-formylfuran-3-yl)methyl phosphate synthase [Gemmataceae bacterium]|nr:(5-formylfuran-3-yl)methyl phosphate synthase [Gemmataceae bacterium]